MAGGASRRMGQPKTFLSFGGEPLLVRVVRSVAGSCDPIVVVAQPGQELPPLHSAIVVCDPISDAGPLVGLRAGFDALATTSSRWAFVCTTDAPWIAAPVIERMSALGEGFDAVVAKVRGKDHVLTALYRVSLADVAGALVESGERRASALAHSSHTRFVGEEELLADAKVREADPDLATFDNVNTPEDLERALERRATLRA